MNRREFMKKAGIGFVGATLIPGCPSLETIIANPLVLDPRYKFNEQDLETFNSWIDQTLEESREYKKNSVIINKAAHELYLIREGQVDSRYNVELGSSPFEDKQKEGDRKTPEGLYFAKRKLITPHTAFHKAYLLDYPNKQDKALKKTGGLIEIHGSGSGMSPSEGGFDWTFGCIAMSNEDIDKIFPHIKEKDRITTVRYTDKNLS